MAVSCSNARLALVVFLLAAIFLWFTRADRFALSTDEGIYLEGAVRVLRGEIPYRDFFLLTGPGTLWLHAAVFRLAGLNLSVARLPVIAGIAWMAAALFWLAASQAGRGIALTAAACFVVFAAWHPSLVVANHRWDSGALALAAVVTVFRMDKFPRAVLAALAGLLAAAAAWVTPPVGLVGIALGAWILRHSLCRRFLAHYLAGFALCSVAAAAVLAWQGALLPFVHQIFWVSRQYSAPNRVPYGWMENGYGSVLASVNGWDLVLAVSVLFCFALPALLPVFNAAAWPLKLLLSPAGDPQERRRVLLLLMSASALVLSSYPRWDILHLHQVAALSYVLTAWFVHSVVGKRGQLLLCALCLAAAAVFLWHEVSGSGRTIVVSTPAGRARGNPEEIALLEKTVRHVKPGQTVFVFPQLPVLYFLTRAVNPTQYSFLQPGMMAQPEESEALAQLRARPPMWVVYRNVPVSEYLRTWPQSDPNSLRMHSIEEFLSSRYRSIDYDAYTDFHILERRPGPFSLSN